MASAAVVSTTPTATSAASTRATPAASTRTQAKRNPAKPPHRGKVFARFTALATPNDSAVSGSTNRFRFRKDILRAETLPIGSERWKVTPEFLANLVKNHREYCAAGRTVPVVWDHSSSARDRTGSVVDLSLSDDGQTLSATLEIDPKVATQLQIQGPDGQVGGGPIGEVSAEIWQDFPDGKGGKFDYFVSHVGLVNHPVMGGQKPFVRLSLLTDPDSNDTSDKGAPMSNQSTKPPGKRIRLANGDDDSEESDGDEGGGASMMSVADVVTILNDQLGIKLPKDIDTEKELRIALATLNPEQDPEESEGEGETAVDAPPVLDGPTMPLSIQALQSKLAREQDKSAKLAQQLSLIQQQQVDQAKAAYEGKLDSLLAAGKLAPASRESLMQVGESAKFQLSLLTPYDDLPAQVNYGGGHARQLAIATPPKTAGAQADGRPDEERLAQIKAKRQEELARRFGRKPA